MNVIDSLELMQKCACRFLFGHVTSISIYDDTFFTFFSTVETMSELRLFTLFLIFYNLVKLSVHKVQKFERC